MLFPLLAVIEKSVQNDERAGEGFGGSETPVPLEYFLVGRQDSSL